MKELLLKIVFQLEEISASVGALEKFAAAQGFSGQNYRSIRESKLKELAAQYEVIRKTIEILPN